MNDKLTSLITRGVWFGFGMFYIKPNTENSRCAFVYLLQGKNLPSILIW